MPVPVQLQNLLLTVLADQRQDSLPFSFPPKNISVDNMSQVGRMLSFEGDTQMRTPCSPFSRS